MRPVAGARALLAETGPGPVTLRRDFPLEHSARDLLAARVHLQAMSAQGPRRRNSQQGAHTAIVRIQPARLIEAAVPVPEPPVIADTPVAVAVDLAAVAGEAEEGADEDNFDGSCFPRDWDSIGRDGEPRWPILWQKPTARSASGPNGF